MRLRLVAAFDLCAWPLLSNLAAVIQGPLLRWSRPEPPDPAHAELDYLA